MNRKALMVVWSYPYLHFVFCHDRHLYMAKHSVESQVARLLRINSQQSWY